jgi:hypothetical protein
MPIWTPRRYENCITRTILCKSWRRWLVVTMALRQYHCQNWRSGVSVLPPQKAKRLVTAAKRIGETTPCDGWKNKPYGAYAMEKLHSIYGYEVEDKRGCVLLYSPLKA